jgi:hypothetical protein
VSRRFLIVGSVCAALGAAAAPSGATRYVLVDDGWGYECYDTFQYGAGLVVPLSGGQPVVRGLEADLARTVQFADRGRAVVWSDASGTRLADLRSGTATLLGRLVRRGHGFFAVDRRARAVLLARAGGRGPHLVLVRRHAARTISGADGVRAGLSPDGRYLAYSDGAGVAVRAVAGGAVRRLGSAVSWWGFAGDRIAYLDGGALHVLALRTGARVADVPLPAEADTTQVAWSPDGRFVVIGAGLVADVRAAAIRTLPDFATESVAWRPGGGHQLLRMAFDASDLVDVSTATELWRRDGIGYLAWSPDGRWLLNSDGPPNLLTHDGAVVAAPAVEPPVDWLEADLLATDGPATLRVARPPRWRPRVLTRGAAGHHLSVSTTFSASPAGLRLLARTFTARAKARDC